MGAAAALLWVRPDVEETLREVEWSVLLFFAALFVLTGGLAASGVLSRLAALLAEPAQNNPLAASLALLWAAALISAVVDNIPFTIAMIPVIQELSGLGVAVLPLWWALALGAGLGGNGTPIGATANVITVALSKKTHTPITTPVWLRSGLPVTDRDLHGCQPAVRAGFRVDDPTIERPSRFEEVAARRNARVTPVRSVTPPIRRRSPRASESLPRRSGVAPDNSRR